MGRKRRAALGYVRVSTHEQAAEGYGIAVQERAVRSWAKSQGVRLVDLEADEGLSGSNGFESRPGLTRVLARLEAGEADLLVVYRLDRLARDLVIQETTLGRLAAKGVNVTSVTEPDIDSDDPTRVLVRQVLGAIGQYERALIRARMMAGKAAKREQGGYAGGRPPFGYRAEGRELVPDASEMAVITRARKLRRAGKSLRQIARDLDAEGLTPKSGERWSANAVRRILSR